MATTFINVKTEIKCVRNITMQRGPYKHDRVTTALIHQIIQANVIYGNRIALNN